jgi:hypothetical protein
MRILHLERTAHHCGLSNAGLTALTAPIRTTEGLPAPALKIGDPRVTPVLAALCLFVLTPEGITNRCSRPLVEIRARGAIKCPRSVTPLRYSYQATISHSVARSSEAERGAPHRLTACHLQAARRGLPGLQHLGSAADTEHQRLARSSRAVTSRCARSRRRLHLPPAPLDTEAERRPPGRQVRIEAQPILAAGRALQNRTPPPATGLPKAAMCTPPQSYLRVDGGRLAKITLG